MPISPSLYEEGTVTLENGNTTVLGDGTAWIVNGVAGGIFARAGLAVPIRAVGGDGELTLAYGWPGADENDVPYCIARESALAADATFVHNSLVKVIRDLSLSALMPDGSGTLAERNALSPVPAAGYIWLRVEVGFPLELYRKETSGWSGPYDLSGPEGPRGEAATVAVNSTTTIEPGEDADVTNSGTTGAALLNFFIPKGEKGDQGDIGPQGPAGLGAGGYGVATGGTAGQIYTKLSSDAGDAGWADAPATFSVADRLALKSLDTAKYKAAHLAEAGREGIFVWKTGNYSTQVTADASEGIYVKADAIAATAGAWVRQYSGDAVVTWFGALCDGTTDDSAAVLAAQDVVTSVFVPRTMFIDAAVTLPVGFVVNFAPGATTTIGGSGSWEFDGGRWSRFVNVGGGNAGTLNVIDGGLVRLNARTDLDPDSSLESRFGTPGLFVNAPGNRNGIVGAVTNNTEPGTHAFPTGVTGYGANYSSGGTVFGIYAEAQAFAPGCVTNEIDSFNYYGTPTITYPPNRSFGIGFASPICLSLGASGDYVSTMALHIMRGGIDPTQFWDGIYSSPDAIANIGLFIDANSTQGPITSALLKNNHSTSGKSNLYLQHVGNSAAAGSAFITANDASGNRLWGVRADTGLMETTSANTQSTGVVGGVATALPSNPTDYLRVWIREFNTYRLIPMYGHT